MCRRGVSAELFGIRYVLAGQQIYMRESIWGVPGKANMNSSASGDMEWKKNNQMYAG